MSIKRVLIAAAIAVTMLAGAPAQAANVKVTLKVTFGEPLVSVPYKTCVVYVPELSNGAKVLNTAKAKGCITSWTSKTFTFGRFVTCIDGICGNAAMYWRMTENGQFTNYGIDGFRANRNDVLGFSYTTWVTCFPVTIAC